MPIDISMHSFPPAIKTIKGRGTMEEVAEAWLKNRPKKLSSETFYTDGDSVWSYRLLIGYTEPDGTKICINYMDETRVSKTTGRHINAVKEFASVIMAPSQAIIKK